MRNLLNKKPLPQEEVDYTIIALDKEGKVSCITNKPTDGLTKVWYNDGTYKEFDLKGYIFKSME